MRGLGALTWILCREIQSLWDEQAESNHIPAPQCFLGGWEAGLLLMPGGNSEENPESQNFLLYLCVRQIRMEKNLAISAKVTLGSVS